MILKREGEVAAEVDLAAPGAAGVPLRHRPDESRRGTAAAGLPDGSPTGDSAGNRKRKPPPGTSPLDAGLRRLDEASSMADRQRFPSGAKEDAMTSNVAAFACPTLPRPRLTHAVV